MTELVVVGAGGLGREVVQYLSDLERTTPNLRVAGFLDDAVDLESAPTLPRSLPILGDTSSYRPGEGDRLLLAVGEPSLRRSLALRLRERGARFFTLVHPTAYVADDATVGEGSIVAPFASVGPAASIGEHALLNLYAAAGHGASVGDYAVLSPYAVASGGVRVGSGAFFGTHAVATPGIDIGEESKVAAGAVVYKDLPPGSLATGNPAKTLPLFPPRRA